MTSRYDELATADAPAVAEVADGLEAEDAALEAGRRRGEEAGASPVPPVVGATLRLLAACTAARAVVELGTGAGVSGTYLLRGMAPDGTLTTIDVDPGHQRLARLTFAAAGFASTRTRVIAGAALDVVPRLRDDVYDMVVVDTGPLDYDAHLAAALRLARPGGLVVFTLGDRGGPGSTATSGAAAQRDLARAMQQEGRLAPTLLPAGQGLLAAVLTRS